jgi:hypothetical protein
MHRFVPTLQRQRFAALTALAAFAVHQLRYLLAGHGGQAGSDHGHDYLAAALPLLTSVSVALVIGGAIAALAGRQRQAARNTRGPLCRWLILSALLATAYLVQELAEGALAADRSGGLGPVLADGGWLALPLALAVGALLALTLRGLDAVEGTLATMLRRPATRAPRQIGQCRPSPLASLPTLTLAFGFARRPPPAAHAQA